LFAFFVDRYQNHPEQIRLFDIEYNNFLEANSYPNNASLSIIDLPTIEALVFITLSRIQEFIQLDTKNDKLTRDRFYKSILSQFLAKTHDKCKTEVITGYDRLIAHYGFSIDQDDYSEESEAERLYQLVLAVRCKVVHFDNESDKETIRMEFEDKVSENVVKKLTFKVSFAQLINFSLHFAHCVNSVLHTN